LALKEIIPDYNPGSELLKTALSTRLNRADLSIPVNQNPTPLFH